MNPNNSLALYLEWLSSLSGENKKKELKELLKLSKKEKLNQTFDQIFLDNEKLKKENKELKNEVIECRRIYAEENE